jgi:hypothetical protein
MASSVQAKESLTGTGTGDSPMTQKWLKSNTFAGINYPFVMICTPQFVYVHTVQIVDQ